jgi:hypothetical protein
MDAYAKTVLTVIAACLLLQVAQGFGLAGAPEAGHVSSVSAESADRYTMMPIPMVRLVFRFDKMTGQTWTMPLQPQQGKFWTLVDEAPSEPMVGEENKGTLPQSEEADEAEE